MAGVDQRRVDLVGEDPAAVPVDHLAHRAQLVGGEHAPEGVVRVGQHQQLAARAEGGVEAVEVECGAPVDARGGHGDDLPPAQARQVEERHVGRGRQDHRPPGRGEVREHDLQAAQHVRDRADVGGRDGQPYRSRCHAAHAAAIAAAGAGGR